MENKIVYDGIRCTVKAKAAFLKEGMDSPKVSGPLIERMKEIGEELREERMRSEGLQVRAICWDDETLARIFDELCKDQGNMKELSAENAFFLRSILEWDGKEIYVESLYYLAFALVKKERCREALLAASRAEPGTFYRAYTESEIRDTPFLRMFIQKDQSCAIQALGLLLLVRREEEGGRYYRLLMEILYSGYKSQKNMIKKLARLEQDQTYIGAEDEDFFETLATVMVQYVIAADLNVPVKEDSMFYSRIEVMERYHHIMLSEYEPLRQDEEMVRKCYRRTVKEYPAPGSFYQCYYLGKRKTQAGNADLSQEDIENVMSGTPIGLERLFVQYGLNLRMLSGISLERKEIEGIFEAMGELGPEEYTRYLFAATLCKYIAGLQKGYDEERQGGLLAQREALQRQKEELKREKDSLAREKESFENRKKSLEDRLRSQEAQIEKYHQKLEIAQEKLEKETEELAALRSFVFLMGEDREKWEETKSVKKGADIRQQCARRFRKSIVVGGHPGWQRKMKQILPDAAFVAADNRQFDFSALSGRESIIINTDILKHSCYFKIMADKRKDQKVLYVHGSNIDRCVEELAGQM